MKSNRVGLRRCGIRASAMLAVAALLGAAPKPATRPATPIDLTTGQTLYAVGYAHLDTQWRWAYPMVIRQFLGNTLHANFPLIEKYPDYIFNFTGARRYQFMKEYFPADYARMKGYIQAGRWFPGGSNVDETDQNVPCAESVVRQVLYGNHYFRQEFGVCGTDFMVPDCFGFPASLPSVLAHCSIKGFSTQKLSWGSAVGIPFNVGVWQGIDGQGVLAALNPTAYTSRVTDDMSHDPTWIARLDDDVKRTGVGVDYRYYGTGDRGGAPAEASILNMEKSVHGGGPVRVVSATSDQMFRDITPAERAKLPVYKGELLLTWHSTGSITSQGYMKRWNRKNELLADAAERASVAASWLGATPYPTRKLYDSWMLLLECQMHDILPGDCLPKCYEYSWNDEVLASNGFAAAETDGVGGVAAAMDTRLADDSGVPLIVYNPLSFRRTDLVEATVRTYLTPPPDDVFVVDPGGHPVPAQIVGREGDRVRIVFRADVPAVSFSSFGVVCPAGENQTKKLRDPAGDELKVTADTLENARYRVTINADGDVEQVVDKANGNRPLLSGPIRLGFLHENPTQYPAWNMDWEDRQKACQEYVGGPATVRVVENGPVRVAVEITRHARGSTFVQRVQLTAGGDRVEFPTHIDWRSTECSLEAVMPMATSNPLARYDVAVGTIERPNNEPKKYEVPQQQWLDLTNPDNSYGVSVLNDCKYGSDKPDDHTIRLTLLYTPGVRGGFQDEGSQDFGKHDMTYALTGHAGDWRAGHTRDQAAEINQPLVAFQATPHAGPLGKSFSLVSTDNPGLTVQAIKKAEDGDEIIVRVKETDDRPIEGAHLKFAAPVVSAREVDGQEAPLGPATVDDGKLRVDLSPYHLRAYAVRLAPPAAPVAATVSTPVQLPLDADVVSTEQAPADGAFGPTGRTYPAEQWPRELVSEGITFHLGDGADGQKNAVVCHGQTVRLPAGAQRAYVLAAADGDRPTQFKVGDRATNLTVQDWGGYIGQWDARLWKGQVSDLTYNWANRLDGLKPGYIKRDSVAWHADHQHDPHDGNEIYQYCYLFKYGFDVPAGATTLTLPDDDHVRVFAVTGATAPHDGAEPARPLYDTLADHVADQPPAIEVDPGHAGATGGEPYHDTVWVHLDHPLYYQDGSLRYTTDGTDPNAASSAYTGPFPLSAKATVTAREFDRDGHAGPAATRVIDVRDTTPPTVVSADGIGSQRHVRVAFSEPVALSSAQDVANYQFDPPLAVRSATLVSDAQGVDLALADGPAVPSRSYRLTVRSIADASPAANVMSATTVTVDLSAPVFTLAEYAAVPTTGPDAAADARGLAQAVPNLPVKATAPWTITCFVRPGAKPDEAVLIAGFGKVGQDGDPEGVGRYLCEFPEGLRYWGRNRDLQSDRPLDANRWQMLSATYDGRTVTLYRNGEPIARGDRALADDEATVRLAPPDPWTGHRFRGELRDFTVWNVPLSERSLQMLWDGRRRD